VAFAYYAILDFTIGGCLDIVTQNRPGYVVQGVDCNIVHNDAICQTDLFVDFAIGSYDTAFDGCLFRNIGIFANETF